MFIAQVLWLQPPQTPEQARAMAEKSAPRFRGKPGLRSKHYVRERETGMGGGIYIWDSRELAEAHYNAEWRARMTAEFGLVPEVRFFDVPLVVDNTKALAEA